MTTTELKRYINKNDKIEYVLEKLGCHHINKFEKKGISHIAAALPDGDNNKGAVIVVSDYLNFYSYSRGIDVSEGKDVIDLVQLIRKCSFVDALKWLHSINEIPFSFKYDKTEKKEKSADILDIFKKYKNGYDKCDVTDIKYLDESILNDFAPFLYIGWLKEGIVPKVAKKFGIMYSYDNKRIVVPIHYWLDGKLIGYNARTTIKDYELLGISKFYITKTMHKGDNLYGLWENRDEIEKNGIVFCCESEKGVLKRASLLDNRWVALEGKTISSEQRRILLGLNVKEIVISLDNDVPKEHVWALCEKFYGIKKVSFTRDLKGLLDNKDSVTDANRKISQYLIDNRINYNETIHKKYLEWLNNK